LITMAASVSYVFLEKPSIDWGKGLAKRRLVATSV